jgi:hypothetical protein
VDPVAEGETSASKGPHASEDERPTGAPPPGIEELARRSLADRADAYDAITDTSGSIRPPTPRSEAPTLNDPSEMERALADARARDSSSRRTVDEMLSPLSMVNSIALSIPPEAPTRPSLLPVMLNQELTSFDRGWADDDGDDATPRPESELLVSGNAPTKPPVGPGRTPAPAETKPPPPDHAPARLLSNTLLNNTEDVFADLAAEDEAPRPAEAVPDIPPAVPSLPQGMLAPEPLVAGTAPPAGRSTGGLEGIRNVTRHSTSRGLSAAPRTDSEEMIDRLSLGNFSGALELAEAILSRDADHDDARRVAEESREKLLHMYTARIGSLERVPQVAIPAEQLRWLSLDHRAGFVLSLIDGFSNVEMILDISGMAHFDALRILCELQEQKIIAVR